MTPYIDKIVVTIGSDNDLSPVQCQDKLHVGLGQFNSKIGIAAQFKSRSGNGIEIENGIGNIGIRNENHVNGLGFLLLLLEHYIYNKHSQEVKEKRSLYFMWLTHHATGVHGTLPPVVWSQKSWMGYLFPLEWTELGVKDGDNKYQLKPPWYIDKT